MLNLNNAIVVDHEGYWMLGCDQAYVDYPIRFPTVTIALESTHELGKAADIIRVEDGYLPMEIKNAAGECDETGWYNFYVSLNGFNDTMLDNSIEALVQSDIADDNEQSICIPLTEAEQIEVYNLLDKQLKERFNTSCDKLLEEARLEMIEHERYEATKGREYFWD